MCRYSKIQHGMSDAKHCQVFGWESFFYIKLTNSTNAEYVHPLVHSHSNCDFHPIMSEVDLGFWHFKVSYYWNDIWSTYHCSYKYMVVPICKNCHWTVVVMSLEDKTWLDAYILDSMSELETKISRSEQSLITVIRMYVETERQRNLPRLSLSPQIDRVPVSKKPMVNTYWKA